MVTPPYPIWRKSGKTVFTRNFLSERLIWRVEKSKNRASQLARFSAYFEGYPNQEVVCSGSTIHHSMRKNSLIPARFFPGFFYYVDCRVIRILRFPCL